ncbi:MAG: DHH family phosphoesterase [Capsulimonadales bacterium]|nr:DHH family phosphoesterase [Capsulimonadales bacterium]
MPYSIERDDYWVADVTYVIGHRRPDTDSIAAALGYAWLLQQTGHHGMVATRAGVPSEQARYALERFEQSPPRLLTDVAATFHHVIERRPAVPPDAPLSVALERVEHGEQIIPVAERDGLLLGIVTPLALARIYARTFNSGKRFDGTSMPTCGELAEPPMLFKSRARLSDHRKAIERAESNEFIVVDDRNLYEGIAVQRRVLQPPKARLILVDHNELSQAVAGAEEAEIVGVLDHHRLGNPPTASPIPFMVDPVGSTSTLVAEQCRARRLTPPRPIAGLLLSGILSDTLVFRSPTTHERDFDAADWLSGVCLVDVLLYGKELLNSSPGLSTRTMDEILDGDRKEYDMGGLKVSLAQVEVTGMQELPQQREGLLQALSDRLDREGLAFIGLMITDVVTGTSRMLVQGKRNIVDALPFAHVADYDFDLEEIVSRKKQLAPALQNAIESTL